MVLRLREWEAGRRRTIGKIGVAFWSRKSLRKKVFDNSRWQDWPILASMDAPVGIATDGGVAAIFPPDKDWAWRSNRLPGDFSRE